MDPVEAEEAQAEPPDEEEEEDEEEGFAEKDPTGRFIRVLTPSLLISLCWNQIRISD
jgi:hypothetical protein